jgi:predicted transcriptional regulator
MRGGEEMSQAVLISIRPKWCEKIISGEKTIEVRKMRPKMDMPFKCYIYRSVQGGVIGEFICDDIFERIVRVGARFEPPKYCICDWNMDCTPLDTLLADACLTKDELEKYLDGGVGYGWHISGLKIYNTPRKLSEFKGLCKVESDCCACPYYNYSKMDCDGRTIKHPPQSWCYVEELP